MKLVSINYTEGDTVDDKAFWKTIKPLFSDQTKSSKNYARRS